MSSDAPRRFAFTGRAALAALLLNACHWGFIPLYPEMARDLAIGPDSFSALVMLPALMNAALVIPVGRCIDRAGAWVFVSVGVASMASAIALRALSQELSLFAFAQFLGGFAWPCFMAALVTGVLGRTAPERRTAALGWIMFASGIGQAFGYVTLGLIGAQFGWRSASFLFAALPLLAIPVLWEMRTPAQGVRREGAGGWLAILRFLLRPRVAALFAVSLTSMSVNNGALYLLPFALRDAGIDAARTGLSMVPLVAGILVSTAGVGRLSARFGGATLVGTVCALSAAGLFAFATAGTDTSVIALSFFLMGLVTGTIATLSQSRFAAVAEATGAVGAGVAVGCARLAQAAGTAIGPAAGGVFYVQSGLANALGILGALAALAAAGATYAFSANAMKR